MQTQQNGTVVVGVAESVFKGYGLRWAAEQAQLEGRALTLVNASGLESGRWKEYDMGGLPGSASGRRQHGEQLLARARALVEKAVPGLGVDELFEVTDPSTLLIQLSSSAHLLVLGSRGRGPVRSHLLGSVGLAVVRQAGCPVVVHRPGDHRGRLHRGVVVAADATAESRPVLAFAFREASLRDMPLKVVHDIYDVRSALVGAPMIGNPSENIERRALPLAESLAGYREDYPDVHLTVKTFPGRLPEEALIQLSRDADLTVVGTHQRGVLARALVGSVSETVLEHVRGPVAVVPTAAPRES